MSINLFEAFSKPKTIIGGRASGIKQAAAQPVVEVPPPPRYSGRDYVKHYIKKEEASYQQSVSKHPEDEDRAGDGGMSELCTETCGVSEYTTEDQKRLNVYDDFDFSVRNKNPYLPIHAQKEEILAKINAYRVIIVKGATGCGKTTQVPQFILNECKERNQHCNIIVTQPRRIAAISVAKRVCEEHGWKMGSVVGYQIGQHREVSDNTLLTFCTTGVLLQKIVKEKSLSAYTHIILDEVHERDSEMDFLLILVRKYANTISRNVKVILMSATINTDTFSEYFYVKYGNEKFFAPVVSTSEKPSHNVRIFYLDDLLEIPEANSMLPDGPDITKKGYITAVKIIKAIDALEKNIAEKTRTKVSPGAVLVFLPGLFEIEEMKKALEEYHSETYTWWTVPLHSTITTEEQDKVFHNPPENHRKIVLSTNIAESSITVPDIGYVIDFGLTKVVVTDQDTNLASLQLSYASKNSMVQRAGRAGRVSEGRVYRLLKKETYETELEEESTPEMLRCPLDQLVLKAKLLDSGPPPAIFALAMNQPDLRNIEQTVLSLKELGALTITCLGAKLESDELFQAMQTEKTSKIDDLDGDMTKLGYVVARLPMDVRLGKLIFFGDLFNVLDECIIMACAMSVKNMFSSPFQEYLKAYNSKLSWANSSCSDCIAYLHAYTVWRKKKSENAFRARNAESEWCRTRYLQLKILKEIAHLHLDVKMRLKGCGIFEESRNRPKLGSLQKSLFIKLALAAAFYPNYFLRGAHSGKVDEKQAVATLSGHDPYSTVYLQGMPNNQHGILYKKTIEKQFEDVSSRVSVHFDHGSKVLINFGHYAAESVPGSDRQRMLIPGKIDLAVYRAVKMRQLKPEIRIPVFSPGEADKRIQNYLQRYEQIKPGRSQRMKLLQWPWDKTLDTHGLPLVELRITNVESPTRFWARSPSPMISQQYSEICEFLNGPAGVIPIAQEENIKVGGVYAYELSIDGRSEYVRCRIESYKHKNNTYGISFIDIGDGRSEIRRNDILAINHVKQNHYDKIPDLATEFSLVKVQPLSKYEGKWAQKAIQMLEKFKKMTDHKKILAGQVYSMVNGVAKVKLYHIYMNQRNALKTTPTINQLLINNNLAEKSEEPFLSKQDHEERKNLSKFDEASFIATKNQTEKEKLIEKLNLLDIDEPSRAECRHEVVLKGPFSPLEMKIFSATQCSMPKLAIIERNSVNSVLLDTNPADEHERMVLASFVSINPSRNKLSLRDTTVMPSLPGLPALICLLFSPMIEMRCDVDFTRFTGALCGLGYEKDTKRALNGDRDMEITFDVEVSLDTLVKINRVRFWLNRFLAAGAQSEMSPKDQAEGYEKLNTYINELIWQKWTPEEMFFTTNAYKWGQISTDRLLNPCNEELTEVNEPADDVTSVYRLIWGIDLDGDKSIRTEMIKKNITLLNEFSIGKQFVKEVECKLCQINLPNRMNARIHVKSSLHRARAAKYLDNSNESNYDSRSEVTDGYDDY